MTTILHTTRGASTIAYDSTVPCLIHTIDESLFNEELRNHLEKGLELFKEKKIVRGKMGWLANLQNVNAILNGDREWFFNEWTPRAAQAGLKYIATVLPKDELTKIAFFEGPDEFGNGITCKYFTDIQSARSWLMDLLAATEHFG
jgi:hypothetical protein